MSYQRWMGYGLTVLLCALGAGCVATGPGVSPDTGKPGTSTGSARAAAVAGTNKCKTSRAACKYEGAYEHGEAHYAEQEARRLNQAALQRFRDTLK